jgi:hypothetical protein
MYNKFLLALSFLFLTSTVFADPVQIKEIEGLKWNRWTSKNFVVLSVDEAKAEYLHDHLEEVKTWVFRRWGMADIDFSQPCKILYVNDAALFEKLFKIKKTRIEIQRDEKGKITETVIFLLGDDILPNTLPKGLTRVCLAELAQKHNETFNPWAYRGMMQLNGSIPQIKEKLLEIRPLLEKDEPLYFVKGLTGITEVQYPKEKRATFDACATYLCLFIRKEFGQAKFLQFLKSSQEDPERAVRELGFDSFADFDKTFKRYMIDLSNDLLKSKTPDRYLQIREGSS